jgi:hypothetical protein
MLNSNFSTLNYSARAPSHGNVKLVPSVCRVMCYVSWRIPLYITILWRHSIVKSCFSNKYICFVIAILPAVVLTTSLLRGDRWCQRSAVLSGGKRYPLYKSLWRSWCKLCCKQFRVYIRSDSCDILELMQRMYKRPSFEFITRHSDFFFFVPPRCGGWVVTSENLGMCSADSPPNGMGTVPVSWWYVGGLEVYHHKFLTLGFHRGKFNIHGSVHRSMTQ